MPDCFFRGEAILGADRRTFRLPDGERDVLREVCHHRIVEFDLVDVLYVGTNQAIDRIAPRPHDGDQTVRHIDRLDPARHLDDAGSPWQRPTRP
jgi:hypothetical protein